MSRAPSPRLPHQVGDLRMLLVAPGQPVRQDEAIEIRRAVCAGLALTFAFFGCFGTWAILASLATGSFAPGVLAVDSRRKLIQHLDGGVVAQILVAEGSRVVEGQPLILLDARERAAERARLLNQFYAATARHARYLAERTKAAAPAFPGWLTRLAATDPEVDRLLRGEARLFVADRADLTSRQQILRERLAQARAERDAGASQTASLARQRASVQSEYDTIRRLFAQGLERRPRLLALEREVAAMDAQLAEARARQAEARGTIAETALRLDQVGASQAAEADARVVEAERAVADLRQRIVACDAALRRGVIRAPVSGTVMNLRPAAPGAVILPGDALMDIVPVADALVVEARIKPTDIDAVHPGLPADVHFLSFDHRLARAWPGRVDQVSADSLTDARSGQAYYRARVVLGPRPAGMDGIVLHPGMPADVTVVTGSRTPLDYLLRPLRTSLRRAMRED